MIGSRGTNLLHNISDSDNRDSIVLNLSFFDKTNLLAIISTITFVT